MGFLYFLPNHRQPISKVAHAVEVGLSHIAENDSQVASRGIIGTGPDGQSAGMLVFDPTVVSPGKAKYAREGQIWTRSAFGDYWVGCWQDPFPDLSQYLRQQPIPGEMVQLDNGQQLLAPIACQYDLFEDDLSVIIHHRFPRMIGLQDGQFIYGEPKRRFRRLWQLAEHYLAVQEQAAADDSNLQDEGNGNVSVTFEFPSLRELLHEAIALNYRFGLSELTLIGGYDDQFQRRLIDILTDEAGFALLQKKRWQFFQARVSGDSCNGRTPPNTDGEHDTAPPSLIGERSPQDATAPRPSMCGT